MNHPRIPSWVRWLVSWHVVLLLGLGGCAQASAPPALPSTTSLLSATPLPSTTRPPVALIATPVPTTAPPTSPVIIPPLAAAPRPTLTPGLPPGFVLPTATPSLPDAVITSDNVSTLHMLRTVGLGGIQDAALAPAAHLLAVATTAGLALFELPSLKLERFQQRDVSHVAISPDGQRLVADGELLRVPDGTSLGSLDGTAGTHFDQMPRFSPDGQFIVTFTINNRADPTAAAALSTSLWHSADGALIKTLPSRVAAFSPDGQLLAVVIDSRVELLRLPTGAPVQTIPLHTSDVEDLAFSADGQRLQLARLGELQIWQIANGQPSQTQAITATSDGAIDKVVFSPSGDTFVLSFASGIGSTNGSTGPPGGWFELRRTVDGTPVYNEGDHQSGYYNHQIRYSADGAAALLWDVDPNESWSNDVLHLVDARLGTVEDLHLPWFGNLAFSPDAQSLATVSASQIYLWHVVDGTLQQTLAIEGSGTGTIRFAPNSQMLAFSGYRSEFMSDGFATVVGWDLGKSSIAYTWDQFAGHVWDVFPNGMLIAQAAGEIDLINATSNITASLDLPSPVSAAAFSPDGTLLAVGDEAGTVRLLRVSDQRPADNMLHAGAKVMSLTFSPDGALLAVRRADGLVQVWHLGEAAPLVHLPGAPEDRLVITSDNQLLISGGQEGVNFYRLRDGQLLSHLDGAVDDLAIGPRRRLLALLRDGQVQMWGVGP